MTEYWLISAPGEKTCQETWEAMNNLTNKQNNLSVNYKFHIPDLKVILNIQKSFLANLLNYVITIHNVLFKMKKPF